MSHCFSTELPSAAGLSEQRFPETKEEAALVEDALAREMQNLSLEEHEINLFELHGINEEHPEDPIIVESKLKQMEIELANLASTEAYNLAKSMNANYVTNHHLAFLRSERYDEKQAAEKIAAYFDVKRQLFGSTEILARDIKQSDLGNEELEFLRSGPIHPCTTLDAAGRGVVFTRPIREREDIRPMVRHRLMDSPPPFHDCLTYDHLESIVQNRAIFYWSALSLKDEAIQKKGIVWIILNFENVSGSFDFEKTVYNVKKSLPARLAGVHYCYTDERLRPYVVGIMACTSKQDRYRKREHLGTREEIEFKLQTYGIPTHGLPVAKDGTWKTAEFLRWLENQRMKEENESKKGIPFSSKTDTSTPLQDAWIVPGKFDVLLGRAGQCREHTGTRQAAQICEAHFEIYEKSTKFQKTSVAEKIVILIKESGGRFLKHTDKGWIEADDCEARNKISHFFRYLREKVQNRSTSSRQYPTAIGHGKTTHEDVAGLQEGFKEGSSVKRVSPPESPFDPEHDQVCGSATQQRRKLDGLSVSSEETCEGM